VGCVGVNAPFASRNACRYLCAILTKIRTAIINLVKLKIYKFHAICSEFLEVFIRRDRRMDGAVFIGNPQECEGVYRHTWEIHVA
jgi:hypothetical protein